MLSRSSVLTKNVTLQQERMPLDRDDTYVCAKGGKSPDLKDSETRRPKRTSLSRFVKFLSGSVKSKKKAKRALKLDFVQPDMDFMGVHFNDVHSSASTVKPSLLECSNKNISRRRSGNDIISGTDSSRAVDINISAFLYDRDLSEADICISPSKYRRLSLPVGYTPGLCEDNTGSRHRFVSSTPRDVTESEEINGIRYCKKSFLRRRLTPRKFNVSPHPFHTSFTQKKARECSKHLHNPIVESYNPEHKQLTLSSKESSNTAVHWSHLSDPLLPEPGQHFKQTVDSFNDCYHQTVNSTNDCHHQTVNVSNDCHKKTANPAKLVGGDRNMADGELKTAGDVQNMDIGSQNQDQLNQTGRVASWAVHFDKLLQDPLGINIFTKFLEKEFSDENIRFWQVCQQFRGLTEKQQQQALAKDIYNRHIAARASDPVNVDSATRSHTEQFLDSPTSAMFDLAQNQIQRLMKLDSYPRFLKSDLYKNMLVEEKEGKVHHEPETTQEIKKEMKQNTGKENGGKRRRSLLPWIRFR